MFKNIAVLLMAGFIVCSCQSTRGPQVEPSTPQWTSFEKEFFSELWTLFPGWATSLGLSDYVDQLKIPNEKYKQEKLQFFKKYQGRLDQISKNSLTTLEAMDYELIKNFLDGAVWEEMELKSSEWDPSDYNVGSGIAAILENGKRAETDKLQSLLKRLALVPEYYEAAFKNISRPTKEHMELAIKQNNGLVSYLEGDVTKRFEKSSLSSTEKSLAKEKINLASKAVQKYISSLQGLKKKLAKTNSFRSFRIGKNLYAKKFVYDLQSSYSAEQMYQKALQAKQETHAEMLRRAKELWPKYFPKTAPPASALTMIKKLLGEISKNHIQPKDFVASVDKQIPQLWDFVVQKNLITLDPKKPLKVRETPVYERGFAGASVDAPGPFDADRETYYNVTPLDGMTPERQESYLREYNNYTLQILNIHEAIPGHYVQLVYSLKSPSLIKRVFGSGTMVEGWAVYTERMMLEEGYGNHQPELWLMYYKWRLRVICNTILDYSLHNLNMSREKALKLLVEEAFQETAEAEEKWNRATYSQVQLASYFTGFTEIYEFRESLKKTQGKNFDLKSFNETFLSYGSSPIRYIRQEMEKNQKTSAEKAESATGAKSL